MRGKTHSPKQIQELLAKARELEIQGLDLTRISWAIGVTDVTLRRLAATISG